MAAPSRPAPTSLLADLRSFALGVPSDTSYGDLPTRLREAGWHWYLRQTGVEIAPDSSVLVTFDVQVGNADHPLTTIDSVTAHLGATPGPVSLAARMGMEQTLLYMVFGRLPPQPNTPPVSDAPRNVRMNGRETGDIILDDVEQDYDQEYVGGDTAQVPDVVKRREPDGLPIFRDLFAFQDFDADVPTRSIVEAVLSEFKNYIDSAESEQQVVAVGAKNLEAFQFIKDIGTEDDVRRLREMSSRRRGQLAAGVTPTEAAPRRRSPAR